MQNAEKISVTLSPEMVRALKDVVESGEFASTSEAVRDAVRVWQRDRAEFTERIAAIRGRVQRSIEDPRAPVRLDEIKQRLATLHAETMTAHGRDPR